MTNINFLLRISIHKSREKVVRVNEIITLEEKMPNSLNLFLMEMYRDQFGEFVCAYWGLKGLKPMILNRINNINAVLALWASHFLLHFSQKY